MRRLRRLRVLRYIFAFGLVASVVFVTALVSCSGATTAGNNTASAGSSDPTRLGLTPVYVVASGTDRSGMYTSDVQLWRVGNSCVFEVDHNGYPALTTVDRADCGTVP